MCTSAFEICRLIKVWLILCRRLFSDKNDLLSDTARMQKMCELIILYCKYCQKLNLGLVDVIVDVVEIPLLRNFKMNDANLGPINPR